MKIDLRIYLLKISFIIVLFACESHKENTMQDENSIVKSEKIIEVNELDSLLKNVSPITIIDVREESEFKKEHIIQAINIWRPQIEDTSLSNEGKIASKFQLEELFSTKGVKNTDLIILYDSKGNPDALRLWWILHYYNFTNVKVLNGGLIAWIQNQKPTEKGEEKIKSKQNFKLSEKINLELYVSLEDVEKAINDTNYIILDTRTKEEYNGIELKGNAKRAGRIPNSKWINYADAIDYQNNMLFRNLNDLKWNYKTLDKNKTIITYCQSGVRSAHTTFVLKEILGFKNVKNYDGSWLEWSNSDQPIETTPILL